MSGTPLTEAHLTGIEQRLKKLENESRLKIIAQLFVAPILLLIVGGLLNQRIEKNKDAIERARTDAQRVDVAQKMIGSMFDGNPTKAFATSRLMRQIVEKDVAVAFDSILFSYYNARVVESVRTGNLDTAAAIIKAAESVGGNAAQTIESSVGGPQVDSIRRYQERRAAAAAHEREGFEELLAGDLERAWRAFQASEDAVNGYRISYEMAGLLRTRRNRFNDPSTTKEILSILVDRYIDAVPSDLREQVVAKARG